MNLLRRFMSDRGKIKSRANTGTCSQHQSDVALAIKNARELALLPYAVRTLAGDKSAGRRGRGGPGGRPTDRPDRPTAPPAAAPTGDAEAAPAVDGGMSETDEVASVSETVEATSAPSADQANGVDASQNDEVQG
jgi:hypothetical protein